MGFEPERGYFPVKNSIAPLMTPDDSYAATMLGLAEAADSGITTLNNWNHNVRSPDDADASLKAHIDAGIRAQFSYGNPDRHPPGPTHGRRRCGQGRLRVDRGTQWQLGNAWYGNARPGSHRSRKYASASGMRPATWDCP